MSRLLGKLGLYKHGNRYWFKYRIGKFRVSQMGSTDGNIYLELTWNGKLYGKFYKKFNRGRT